MEDTREKKRLVPEIKGPLTEESKIFFMDT